MDKNCIDIYQEFANHIEYPMVVFEAESGTVLGMNYDAEVLLGTKAEVIHMEPGRTLTTTNFWETLHGKKSMIWHRIRLNADGKEILVSGLINETIVGGKLVYSLLFERRSDMNIGSVTLERIVNHANIVAIHICVEKDGYKTDYISQNINRYGYTRAQLYEGKIQYSDIICAEDIGEVHNHMQDAISKKTDESVIECRFLSEQRELIPVRLLIHYVYNEYGNILALEVLALDLSEEMRKNRERNYLNNAISKMKSVVLVKSYKHGRRILRYISPNAEMVGMNVEALMKGYRLTEDYIHPDDRDEVIDTIYQAVDSGITDYVQEYRMVRDDGRRIWVENIVTVNRVSDGEAEISFLLTDITERKELEQEIAATVEPETEPEMDYGGAFINQKNKGIVYQFESMAKALGTNAHFYNVLLDTDGRQLFSPVGPSDDMGLFYDLFERPEFKEKFTEIVLVEKDDPVPHSVTFMMNKIHVNIVFAPIVLGSDITAYWVMANFGENGLAELENIQNAQWRLTNAIAKCFYADEIVDSEVHRRKIIEMQLAKEQKEQTVMEELVACMSDSGVAGIGEICQKAGLFLNVTDIGIYKSNKKNSGMELYYQWSQTGDDSEFFKQMEASDSEHKVIQRHFKENGVLVADKNLENPFLKGLVNRTGMGAIMLVELKIEGKSDGYVMIADTDKNREFDKHMIRFTKTLTNLFGRMLSGDEKSSHFEMLHEGFLDAYNHIRDAVFVKNNRSGDIIFANKATEKLFGYSLEGRQASEIITDQLEQYRAMQGVRKRLIADKKITKWQSYMKELDQIMNIVEVHLDTINGADCSLIVLKKNKNKDKKKDDKKN